MSSLFIGLFYPVSLLFSCEKSEDDSQATTEGSQPSLTAKLQETDMTACRAYGLLGKVRKVTDSDGSFMEFDARGNLVRRSVDGGKTVIEYPFKSANRYTDNELPVKIVFENDNVRKEMLDNGEGEGLYTAWTFDKQGRVVKETEIGYPGHETEYRYRGDELLPYESITKKEEDETGKYIISL
ncbi:MAG: hypothetical protein LBC19_11255 [Tannerella sp.]|nr:hypothetical protein [Tannerella sp.]